MSALDRRSFLRGLIVAPAVIRVAPLMRIAPLPLVLGDAVEASNAMHLARIRQWLAVVEEGYKRGIITRYSPNMERVARSIMIDTRAVLP